MASIEWDSAAAEAHDWLSGTLQLLADKGAWRGRAALTAAVTS